MDKLYCVVFVTVPNIEDGRKIAQILVRQKLAACVNILPGIISIYTWEDEICEDREVLMVIKTRTELFDALSATVQKEHPYEVPEVIAVPLESGTLGYLGWIDQVTQRL
jgi:periplasmic divalent cation tolerance protein